MGNNQGDQWRKQLPAWPLGCALALLALLFIVTLLGLAGIALASAKMPIWLSQVALAAVALTVPLAMLLGAIPARKRNPYGARVLLWGGSLTVAFATAFTLLFNLIDRLNGL